MFKKRRIDMKKFSLVFFIFLLLFSCTKEEHRNVDEEREIQKNVKIGIIDYTKSQDYIKLSASVVPKESAKIISKVMGEVQNIFVKEGDYVKQGDIILKIDDRLYRAKLNQATSGVEETKKYISATEKEILGIKAQYSLAEKNYHRFLTLKDKEVISRQKFDEVETNYLNAKASLQAAQEKLKSLKEKLSQALAQVDEAKTFLSYTEITAPFNGKVIKKFVDIGDSVAPGSPLVQLQLGESFQIRCMVPEKYINLIHKDQPISAAILNREIVSKVNTIVPLGDELSRSYEVKLDIPTYKELKPGMYATVYVPQKLKKSIYVPKTSIIHRGQITGMFIVDKDNVINFRLVRTGRKINDKIEIISGVSPGERYVIAPTPSIKDGDIVNLGG